MATENTPAMSAQTSMQPSHRGAPTPVTQQTATSPPSRRELASWWRTFRKTGKKEEEKGKHNISTSSTMPKSCASLLPRFQAIALRTRIERERELLPCTWIELCMPRERIIQTLCCLPVRQSQPFDSFMRLARESRNDCLLVTDLVSYVYESSLTDS